MSVCVRVHTFQSDVSEGTPLDLIAHRLQHLHITQHPPHQTSISYQHHTHHKAQLKVRFPKSEDPTSSMSATTTMVHSSCRHTRACFQAGRRMCLSVSQMDSHYKYILHRYIYIYTPSWLVLTHLTTSSNEGGSTCASVYVWVWRIAGTGRV